EVGKSNMKYPVFYNALKRKFGAKWDMVPIDRFLELSTYIQDRIEKTVLGKKLKAQGKKSYSTFEEYLAKNCS
ncbi:TPA: HNH endonuclease, partial [Vibrio cholerae]|nr:HNH endonuclease [Vibrio cholerae]HBN6819665.1 HNH endonuclease [Vibrio cholerae]